MLKWPRLFAIEVKKDCCVSDRFPEGGGAGPWRWCWSKTSFNSDEAAELDGCLSLLGGLLLNTRPDKWRWSTESSCLFSTASVKALAEVPDAGVNRVWKWKGCWIPLKCKIFVWRSVLDRIPTRKALARRNVHIDSEVCSLCGEVTETWTKFFFACEVAIEVWHRLSSWAKIPPIFAFAFGDLLVCYKWSGLGKEVKDIVWGLIVVSCWCIWKARNGKIFSNGRKNSFEIFREVKSLGFLWLKSRSKHRNIVWSERCNYPLYMLVKE
ncbi:putative reverse transcriptase zinc-binding domain-containing protein [Helianthus anomalus]